MRTSTALTAYASHMELATMTWLGDGPLIAMYMRRMERFFAELFLTTPYSIEQKREIIAGHMRQSKDTYIMTDLALFDQAGDTVPVGWQYSFDFLWQSMRRRVDFYTKLSQRGRETKHPRRSWRR